MAWEMVFVGGKVHIAGRGGVAGLMVAVGNGRICFVGQEEEGKAFVRPATEIIDTRGKLLVPGFHDAHLHPMIGALDFLECSLHGLPSVPEYLRKLREYAASVPERGFLSGSGWVYGVFPLSGPRASDLDSVEVARPVFIKAIDGHSAWVNSAALRLGGITRETVAPAGGIVEKDPVTGEPTGVLREWPAMRLVTEHFPKPSVADYEAAVGSFFQIALGMGLTSLHDGQGKDPFPEVYLSLDGKGALPFRVTACRRAERNRGTEQVPELLEITNSRKSGRFRFSSVKFFLDGVVEGRTAHLLAPYQDSPGSHGEPLWEPSEFKKVFREVARAGLATHTHAVGDAAVRLLLESVSESRKSEVVTGVRHELVHGDLFDPEDIPRVGRLGMTMNVQPAWFCRDSNFPGVTLPALGPERIRNLYPLRSLIRGGARVAFSSDWPFGGDTVSCDPLLNIETAVTRRPVGSPETEPLIAEESVDLVSALDAHTLGAAAARDLADETGSIKTGKAADLVLLDRDLYSVPPEAIHEARVEMTMVEGKTAWRRK